MVRAEQYVRLADHVCLRQLEQPCLYDRRRDELYELNQEGFEALRRCRGHLTLAQVALEPEFQQVCLKEGLIVLNDQPWPRPLALGPSPEPSLRYLELQITWRCNLACGHCYLGPAQAVDLPLERIADLAREFEVMGGLRLMLSGGEPLLHPRWSEVNAALAALPLRRVLLTNGLLLRGPTLEELHCEEVQISLDGTQAGHDRLRGPGSFVRALAAAQAVRDSGRDLSIATMVHAGNLDQFEALEEIVRGLAAIEWGIDAPSRSGRLADNPELAVSPAQAAQAMGHAFGGAFHGGGEGMACGLHLCTVAADGLVAQCGFYLDQPLGRAEEGLWTCWQRRRLLALTELTACAQCAALDDCGGGCRFRAANLLGPDLVMCALHGVEPAQANEE
ncbi:MAG: radical SAM protein [Thermodesulfobacteriota bacterium]